MNIKDYFSFTRGERRGSLVLICILLIVFTIRYLEIPWLNDRTPFDPSEFEQEVAEFLAQSNEPDNNSKSDSLFKFNPNNTTEIQWKLLGFTDWQIKSINNYIAKGGQWKTKKSFSRLYGLNGERYEQLKPYIQLPDKEMDKTHTITPTLFKFNPNSATPQDFEKLGFKDWQIQNIEKFKANGGTWKSKAEFGQLYGLKESTFEALKPYIELPDSTPKPAVKKVNINTANPSELLELDGINSLKYAKIVSKYRDKLGGFSTKEQLLEVWGMKPETLEKFSNQLNLEQTAIRKLNINELDAKALVKHPYIDWKVANTIEKYRKQHGNFGEIEELRSLHLIDEKIYQKIAPYLKLEE